MDTYTAQALEHIRYLSQVVGGRGSTTPRVRQAGEYVTAELVKAGVTKTGFESFKGSASTYTPFTIAFFIAAIGSALALIAGSRNYLALGGLLNLLGAWVMLAETDYKFHWVRPLLNLAPTQNVVGIIPPAGDKKHCAVLFAHLDTHRSPIFYSSTAWQNLFGFLVTATFLSMAGGFLLFGLGALVDWTWVRLLGMLLIPFQLFTLFMVGTADGTPHNPGANDDASGVGALLALAQRLKAAPMQNTEVVLLFTDCEETASYGILSFLDNHAAELGPEAVYVTLDEVAFGVIKYLSADGLIIKHPTHPKALQLARSVARALPGIKTIETVGLTYTDALPATMRGRIALTLCTVPAEGSASSGYWHQMGDTIDHIQPQTLENVGNFTWELLQQIDRGA
jgi:hypothetical protein